jgi:hypothetical protein
MVKFSHLLILSVLIFWLAGSGCVGNDASEVNKSGEKPGNAEVQAPTSDLEIELTHEEIQELDSDMADLEILLENASIPENIQIEEL